ADRQPRTTPTASTIVSASTASTALAAKVVRKSRIAWLTAATLGVASSDPPGRLDSVRALGYAVSSIAGLVAVGAGIYLLTRQSATAAARRGVLAPGAGFSFRARAFFMIAPSTSEAASSTR